MSVFDGADKKHRSERKHRGQRIQRRDLGYRLAWRHSSRDVQHPWTNVQTKRTRNKHRTETWTRQLKLTVNIDRMFSTQCQNFVLAVEVIVNILIGSLYEDQAQCYMFGHFSCGPCLALSHHSSFLFQTHKRTYPKMAAELDADRFFGPNPTHTNSDPTRPGPRPVWRYSTKQSSDFFYLKWLPVIWLMC